MKGCIFRLVWGTVCIAASLVCATELCKVSGVSFYIGAIFISLLALSGIGAIVYGILFLEGLKEE